MKKKVLIGVMLVLLVFLCMQLVKASKPSITKISVGRAGIISGKDVGYSVWATQSSCDKLGFHYEILEAKAEGKAESLEEAKEMVNIICARLKKDFPAMKISVSFWWANSAVKGEDDV